jgi:hypothetical protein
MEELSTDGIFCLDVGQLCESKEVNLPALDVSYFLTYVDHATFRQQLDMYSTRYRSANPAIREYI